MILTGGVWLEKKMATLYGLGWGMETSVLKEFDNDNRE